MIINTLSKYYLFTPFVSPLTGLTCTSYDVWIYVWSGAKTDVPTSPNYKLTKKNIGGSVAVDKTEIASLVNDFIDFFPSVVTGEVHTDSQKWCKKEIYYHTSNESEATTPQIPETFFVVKGKSYGDEGENFQPDFSGILIKGNDFKVNRNTIFTIPIAIPELVNQGDITVLSYPNSQINKTYVGGTTNVSSLAVKLINVDVQEAPTDTEIRVTYNGRTVFLKIEEEFRYKPINVYFLNKQGVQQTIVFFKERRDSLSIEKSTYENDRGQPLNGIHQFVDYVVNGRHKVVANSGFVDESTNESFKELVLSPRVYLINDIGSTIFLSPVNISQASFDYKTRVNDKLINYEITFDYSYNEINNI